MSIFTITNSRAFVLLFGFFPSLFVGLSSAGWAEEHETERLFEERIRSVVAVRFFVETEISRQPSAELGIVADGDGLIVLPEHAVPGWMPAEQLKEFKVTLLRTRTEFPAEYLGQEGLNGWHFLRVSDPEFIGRVTPVTAYPVAEPRMGDPLWGIAVMDEDYDFEPYYLASQLSLMRELPQWMGFTMAAVSSPGSLVFAENGDLVGWATLSYLREAVLHVNEERLAVAIQGLRESGAFYPALEVLPYLDRIPETPDRTDRSWMGVSRLQPVEGEVAKFLGIEEQGAVILSEIIEGSPAAEADLEKGDILVAIDGERIPYYRPHQAVTQYVQREVQKREPGATMRLTLLRDSEEIEREVEVGMQPPTLREARREYFEKIGITVREFLLFDGVARRTGIETDQGLIVQFIRPNSPAHTAGMMMGDWIKEIDGVAAKEYEDAVQGIAKALEEGRAEIVFLIGRQNETSVVRVRLE